MFISCKNIEYVKKGVIGLKSIVKIYFVLYFVLIFFYDVCSYKIFVNFYMIIYLNVLKKWL